MANPPGYSVALIEVILRVVVLDEHHLTSLPSSFLMPITVALHSVGTVDVPVADDMLP